MSRGVNKVILLGNLGADPDIRYTQNQKQVANLSIATSESWTDRQTGQKQEKTEWHKVVFFDRLAEIAGQYLKKGSKIYIEGKIQTRKWQNQQGVDQYTTEIIGNEMQMLDGRGDGGGGGQNYGNAGYQQQPQQQQQGGYQQQPQQQAPQHQQVPQQQAYAAPAPQYQQPAPQHQQVPQQQAYAAPAPVAPQAAPQPVTQQPQQPAPQPYAAPAPAPQQPAGQAFNDFDDEIPF